MKVSKFINMIGVILVITFFILRGFYPEILSGFLWIGIATVLCIMMLYKTENVKPINMFGLTLVLTLGVLSLIIGDELGWLLSGLSGLVIVILLSILVFYNGKTGKINNDKILDDVKNDK